MSIIKVDYGTLGGGKDWITPTYSNNNQTISCTWDYDADCVILLGNLAGYASFWYIPVDNSNRGYFAATNATLQSDTLATGITMTKRSLTIAKNYVFSSISIMPIPSKPTIYS